MHCRHAKPACCMNLYLTMRNLRPASFYHEGVCVGHISDLTSYRSPLLIRLLIYGTSHFDIIIQVISFYYRIFERRKQNKSLTKPTFQAIERCRKFGIFLTIGVEYGLHLKHDKHINIKLITSLPTTHFNNASKMNHLAKLRNGVKHFCQITK